MRPLTTSRPRSDRWYVRDGGGQGYITAALGTILGAFVLGGLGALPAVLPCEGDGYSCLGGAYWAFFLAPTGLLVGSILGCYVALRVRDYARADLTAWLFVPLLIGAAMLVASIDARIGGGSKQVWLPAALCSIALPLAARFVVCRFVRDRQRLAKSRNR